MKRHNPLLCGLFIAASTTMGSVFLSEASAQSEARPSRIQQSERAAIIKLFELRAKTFNQRDLKGQLALVDDDVVIATAIGQLTIRGKHNYGALMLFIWNRGFKDKILSEQVRDIEFLNENMALVQLKLSITPAADFPYDDINAMRVVVKKKGKWLIRSTSHIPYRRQMPLPLEDFYAGIKARKKDVLEVLR